MKLADRRLTEITHWTGVPHVASCAFAYLDWGKNTSMPPEDFPRCVQRQHSQTTQQALTNWRMRIRSWHLIKGMINLSTFSLPA